MNGELLHLEGTSVTWKGREATGTVARATAITGGYALACLTALVLACLSPLLVVAHAALWLAGYRGLVYRDDDGRLTLEVPGVELKSPPSR
jgi:hypothetical protein